MFPHPEGGFGLQAEHRPAPTCLRRSVALLGRAPSGGITDPCIGLDRAAHLTVPARSMLDAEYFADIGSAVLRGCTTFEANRDGD
jgi:hypothetical protein